MSENARVIFQPTNQLYIPEMPSLNLFRLTKGKGRNELQVVKENLGGSEGVGIKKMAEEIAHNLHAHIPFLYICKPFSSYQHEAKTCFALCGQREYVTKKCQFSLSISKTLMPI